ncbi:hypothetical protein [Brumimicrobium oceani]|uniref:Lipoprotein n=1 Tax=Brumimicrobium oceani TaxID=2100725 RepID=A0A2U2XHJ4_9FLAO|nr:hypothetical protein [Brumimicrobium oceani]PWH87227.1 hypothetical protein DIT68_02890 [Brumimicrobium oceani]
MSIKRKLLFIITFSLTACFAFTQDYSSYYQGINKARKAIALGNHKNGIEFYYETFIRYDFVFARDCYNAIEISAFENDTIRLNYFIRRGLKQGVSFQLISSIKNLEKYQGANFFTEITIQKDSLANIYLESINHEIRKEMNEMFKVDQDLREEYYSRILFRRIKIGKKWEELNRNQVHRIIEMTREHGFPGEKLIGIDTKAMHPKIGDYNLSAGMPIVIFIHHYSKPNTSFNSLLFEEIQKGNLYNEHFATISDFEVKFGKSKHSNFGFFSFKQTRKNENPLKIDQRRKQIGLITLEEENSLKSVKIISKFWNRLY